MYTLETLNFTYIKSICYNSIKNGMTLIVAKKRLHWASIWVKIMNNDFIQDKIPTVNTIRKRSILARNQRYIN